MVANLKLFCLWCKLKCALGSPAFEKKHAFYVEEKPFHDRKSEDFLSSVFIEMRSKLPRLLETNAFQDEKNVSLSQI